jgi:hypothetical protein
MHEVKAKAHRNESAIAAGSWTDLFIIHIYRG